MFLSTYIKIAILLCISLGSAYITHEIDYSSIEIKKDLKNNSLYLTVKDRYDTIKIEILPNKNIYMGDKIYQYTTCSDIMKIFREG